jgi:hypothetical protein
MYGGKIFFQALSIVMDMIDFISTVIFAQTFSIRPIKVSCICASRWTLLNAVLNHPVKIGASVRSVIPKPEDQEMLTIAEFWQGFRLCQKYFEWQFSHICISVSLKHNQSRFAAR